jgi:hypothetical protein
MSLAALGSAAQGYRRNPCGPFSRGPSSTVRRGFCPRLPGSSLGTPVYAAQRTIGATGICENPVPLEQVHHEIKDLGKKARIQITIPAAELRYNFRGRHLRILTYSPRTIGAPPTALSAQIQRWMKSFHAEVAKLTLVTFCRLYAPTFA